MISENELRKLIREYCHTEFNKAKNEWVDKNIHEFREILNEIRNTNDYGLLKEAIRRLHSGKMLLGFTLRLHPI
ncbi:hypothetical protein [Thermococcus sp.]|uniref:hypothetical protein n=1 Tax=Thermococcus sp. TaxID=35749 RepID=UPI002639AF3C|nr:hypothetical protein [Thermococcus sp.]